MKADTIAVFAFWGALTALMGMLISELLTSPEAHEMIQRMLK